MQNVAAATGTREERGRQIARTSQIKPVGRRFVVPSQTRSAGVGSYVVDLADATCTCPDYATSGFKCKHQHAVEFFIIYQTNNDGTVTETRAVRRTYSQNWPAYNAAQTNEKEHFERLLRGLCDGIQQPPQKRGRPRLPLGDLVYGAVHKVYSTVSGRRAQTDLRVCSARGLVEDAPSYNSIFRCFESPSLTPILTMLIEEAAAPLASVESQFAVDSTGFSTSSYRRWFDEKYVAQTEQVWVKLHAMVGTETNVITAAVVASTGDCPMLPPLLATTAKRFTVEEVSGDKAYLSKYNVEAINAIGATPYIVFKDNSTGKGPELWRKMYAHFMLKRPDFLDHYHRRSNVETTFHMVKSKFGAAVRSKLPVAQANEVLAKALCHNICCLISAIYESGLKPEFWATEAMS